MSRTKELPSSNVGKYIQLVGLILACGALPFSYMKKEGLWLYADTQLPDTAQDDGVGRLHAAPANTAATSSQRREGKATTGFAEQVQQAIITVTTPWGQGTGFFLKEDVLITGQYLVEPDLNKMAALEDRVIRNKKILQRELAQLADYHARLSKMQRRKAKKALSLLITEREEYLAHFRAQQEKDEQILTQQKQAWKQAQNQPGIRVILANRVEQQAALLQSNADYGLALLSLPSAQNNSVLKPPLPRNDLLRLGAPVILPRSVPVDGRNWTFGTFAGYRRIGPDNRMYLQIEAKLSQNKSGTPVLDSAGFVRGVVTQVGQGPIFAVPVEKVLDAFAGSLP
ncbi:S1 family peptidase [Candidatus Electrothrix sp.]|uniref:S1 family peptidase n=1 Tax=Candidatus Electrothrix sp. TaxID=2170559 RepID=UPI0040577EFF